MPLAHDLLLQAEHLVRWDSGKPKQANLRRGISTAYYALFHLLASACMRRIGPSRPPGLQARVGRALSHSEMKEVCTLVSQTAPAPVLLELLPGGFSAELKKVALTFLALQEARHRADYDSSAIYNRPDTLRLIERTQEAFTAWRSIRSQSEIDVFLSAILFARRWGR